MSDLVVGVIIQTIGKSLVPAVLNWEMSFAPGVGAVAPKSVRVCARIVPARTMRTLIASIISNRFIFIRQDWKLKFEYVIKIVTGLSPALKHVL